jgi:hypothetical protein
VIELAKAKSAELPVIIILPTIAACEEYEALFENYWIFGKGIVPE